MTTAMEETTVTFNPGTEDELTVAIDDEEGMSEGVKSIVGGLFDADPYTLPIPRVDGQLADALELTFAGKVMLDPHDERDLELIRRLKLDADVTLRLEAAVAGKAFKCRRGEEETTATHSIALKVHTLYRDEAGVE